MPDESELDRLLDCEPRNIQALVDKGDLRAAAGDERAARAFYKAALSAAHATMPLPAELKPVIDRALAGIARAEARFHAYFESALTAAGFGEERRPPRFQHAVDLLLGRVQTELGLQQPTSFYYPGLPQRRYFESSEFAWAGAVEAATSAIRDEYLATLSKGDGALKPYLVNDPTRPRTEFHGLRDNPQWSTLELWDKGRPAKGVTECFRRTITAVEASDLPRISVRAPNILFSRLSAGATIPPHHGMLNTRLVCHLPLVVPPGCGFRVGGEKREWQEGELLIFDDTIEHEAWNRSDRDRVVLIFDVWRPELDAEERRAIVAMFEAIDAS